MPGSSHARCCPGLPAFCPSWGLPASPSVCTRPPSNTAQRTSLLLMCKCKHWWGLSVRSRKDATVPGHLLPRVDRRLQEEASSEPRLSAGKQVPANNSAVGSSVPEFRRPRKMGAHHGGRRVPTALSQADLPPICSPVGPPSFPKNGRFQQRPSCPPSREARAQAAGSRQPCGPHPFRRCCRAHKSEGTCVLVPC